MMGDEPFSLRPLTAHTDGRGTLFEVLRFKDDHIPGEGYIYSFSVNPGERRGDHYHEKKHEWFSVVAGRATILVEAADGRKARFEMSAESPGVAYFAPGTAHAIVNESDASAVVVSYGSKQYDPADPDAVRKVLEH